MNAVAVGKRVLQDFLQLGILPGNDKIKVLVPNKLWLISQISLFHGSELWIRFLYPLTCRCRAQEKQRWKRRFYWRTETINSQISQKGNKPC